jgi:hypothetical protein
MGVSTEMIPIKQSYIYTAFGYQITSEIELPELISLGRLKDQGEITIKMDNLNHKWNQIPKKNQFFVITENQILFGVPKTGIFLIENGKKIVVSIDEGADKGLVRLFILGTCMGAILLQKKVLPLHGSAIVINGKAYAVVGESGVGKSTLASAFYKNGFQMLSDDIVAVSFNEDGKPVVSPAYPQQKLWQDSLRNFKMSTECLTPLYGREKKYSVPVTANFINEKIPLAGIFELVTGDKIEISPITGLERFHSLYRHTYRNLFLNPQGLIDWHFQLSAKLLNLVSLYRLQRPSFQFTAPAMASLILEKINGSVY